MTSGLEINLENYLLVGAILFVFGAVGFLARRNLILLVLSAEMMVQGAALSLAAYSRYHGNLRGQAFVLFLVALAACEAAIALALILVLYRARRSLDVNHWQELREADQPPVVDEEPLPSPPPPPSWPRLPPAGLEPSAPQEEQSHV
jgi:NADH-quinone oxidoreductase subunit K